MTRGVGWKLAELEDRVDIKGSYQTLLINAYNQQNAGDNRDSGIQDTPLSFLRGGLYQYENGDLPVRGERGHYLESKASNSIYAFFLYFRSITLDPRSIYSFRRKGDGYSIRCVVR